MQSLLQKLLLGNAGGGGGGNPSLNLNFVDGSAFDPRITFSRTTNATLTDSTGLVAYAPHNLLTYSEQFDDAAWTKTTTTVVSNATTAPDGTVTGDKLIVDTGTTQGNVLQAPTYTANASHTGSAFVKASEWGWVVIELRGTDGVARQVWFNVTSGTVGTANNSATGAIINFGNGWYRCVATATLPSGASTTRFRVYPTNADNAFSTGDGTSGVFVWGSQASVNPMAGGVTSSLSTYYPTTATAYYGPRFDYDPVTLAAKGLLIEEQRTNLLTYSEDFSNAAWTASNATVTTNSTASPDGATTADKLVENTATSTHLINPTTSASFTSGVSYTLTIYAKAAERYRGLLTLVTGTTAFGSIVSANFDLQAGTITAATGSPTVSIAAVGNGWYRLSISKAAVATVAESGTGLRMMNETGATNYTGDGTSGIFIWGAQLEAGAFATSYIPTVASQVTRNADSASMTGANFSSWYNATEGTIYSETGPTADGVYPTALVMTDGTTSNNILIQANSTAVSQQLYVVSGGAVQVNLATQTFSNALTKTAAAYKANDYAYSTQGAAVSTDTTALVPTVSQMVIGAERTSNLFNGCIRRITYYPTRLTNAALQQITT